MNQDLMELFQETTYLKKAKDGTYVINLDEYADVGTHWIALFCNRNEIVYFDSFGVEHVPKENSKYFSSTSKQFSNVWLLLHRIY